MSGCCQRPSRPTMSTVAVSVPYWGHTAAVCLLVDGITRLWLPTHPHRPSHPPPINFICDITAVGKNYLKTQQYQLRYSPDATSHSQAGAREQALEVVRVYALFISSVHLLYFECTLHCRVSTRHEVTRE